jgi:L-asparaginase
MKRLYIVYTGGTIGMRHTPDGYAPEPGLMAKLMRAMPEMADPVMPEFDIHEYDPLLDSSNMRPRDWVAIGQDIVDHYDAYDGFVVLHGTDTMAYTASALPFLLQGLGKPVVVTGSQIPLSEVRSDARANLISALLVAARCQIPEVCLCFGSKLLRGCRATKVDAEGFEAFDSPHYPPLGALGVDIRIDHEHVAPLPEGGGVALAPDALTATVGALRLFPGMASELLAHVLEPPLQGLVLETYGSGSGPTLDTRFLDTLAEATGRGVVVVAITQCLRGSIHIASYATGSALSRAGVISGHDMTAEAALCKMCCLFSAGGSPASVREMMGRNLRGELTAPVG